MKYIMYINKFKNHLLATLLINYLLLVLLESQIKSVSTLTLEKEDTCLTHVYNICPTNMLITLFIKSECQYEW